MKMRTDMLSAVAILLLAMPASDASASGETLRIGWADLRPADQKAGLLAMPAASDSGRRLSAGLEGEAVEITGFLLPSDRDGSLVYEFMLVPTAGACSHAPQPAPNQVVRVTPERPFDADGSYQLVTVKGMLEPGFDKAQLFILDGVRVVESGYSIASAVVEARRSAIPAAATGNPWKFLGK